MNSHNESELVVLRKQQQLLQEQATALLDRLAALDNRLRELEQSASSLSPSAASSPSIAQEATPIARAAPIPPRLPVAASPALVAPPALAATPSTSTEAMPAIAVPPLVAVPLTLLPLTPAIPPVPAADSQPSVPPMVSPPSPVAEPLVQPTVTARSAPEMPVKTEPTSAAQSIPPIPPPILPSIESAPVETPVVVPDRSTLEAEPTPQPEAAPAGAAAFEMRLGTYWFVRLGVVMFLTGLVWFAAWAYSRWNGLLGPGGKVALLYLTGGALLGAGARLQRQAQKPGLRNYGQVLFAGGLAAVYFITFAAHHFPNLLVIRSALLDGVLLLAWAGFIAWLADRKKSELLAVFGLGLAYYTSFITAVGQFTLYSNLVLTLASIGFLVRNRWAGLSFGSLLATYAGFAFWRFHQMSGWGWDWDRQDVWTGNWFLAGYWLVFTAGVFLSREASLARGGRTAFLTLNNGAFFSLVILSMFHAGRESFWIFSLVYGGTLLGLSALARRLLAGEALTRNAYLVQGLLLVTVGLIAKLTGLNLALALATESVVLVLLDRELKNPILSLSAQLLSALAVGWTLFSMHPVERVGLWVGVAVGAMAVFNAFWSRPREEAGAARLSYPSAFYTLLGLLAWGVDTWRYTQPESQGLVLAAESVALMLLSQRLPDEMMRLGAYPFAAIAAGLWTMFQDPLQIAGLYHGIGMGALIVFNASWQRGSRDQTEPACGRIQVLYFTALALFVWFVASWNFVSHPWRELVLAGESTLFLLASRPLRSEPFAYGAYLFAVAAVGWQMIEIKPLAPPGLWTGTMVGLLMLINAHVPSRWLFEGGRAGGALRAPFFTVLGQWTWLITAWNLPGEWRGISFACASVSFLLADRWLHNRALELGSWLFGFLAVALEGDSMTPLDHAGLYRGIVIGALLMFNAFEGRISGRSPRLRAAQEAWFSLLGLFMWLMVTKTFCPKQLLALVLAAECLLFTAAYYPLRLRSLTILGQSFLLLAQLQGCINLVLGDGVPWWHPALLIIITLLLSHWWQRQQTLSCSNTLRTTLEAAYAFAIVSLLFCWLKPPTLSAGVWLGATSLLALAIAGYGIGTRAWRLAGASQWLLAVSVVEFVRHVVGRGPEDIKPSWWCALAPIATLFVFAGPVLNGLTRRDLVSPALRQPLHALSLVYRGAGLLMTFGWVFAYIPAREQIWVLAVLGAGFYAWAGWQRMLEPLVVGAVFTLVAFFTFCLRADQPNLVYLPNLLAIVLLLTQQRAARRWPDAFPIPPSFQTGMILLGGCSFWLLASRTVVLLAHGVGFYLTAAWVAVAVVLFLTGFILRDRMYRWHGLAVLGCALGRVLVSDVWELDTPYRILSFMALGVAMLVLGFIYTKYQEKIREWL